MSKAREKFFEAIDFLADQMYMTIAENIVTHVTDIESKVEQLEAEKAELIDFIKDLYFSELNDNDTTELTTRQVICLTTLYKKYNMGE